MIVTQKWLLFQTYSPREAYAWRPQEVTSVELALKRLILSFVYQNAFFSLAWRNFVWSQAKLYLCCYLPVKHLLLQINASFWWSLSLNQHARVKITLTEPSKVIRLGCCGNPVQCRLGCCGNWVPRNPIVPFKFYLQPVEPWPARLY